jgi:hypothetical protein
MNARRSDGVANSARFEATYGALLGALLLATVSCGCAFALGVVMERLTARDLNGSAAVLAQVATYDPAEGTSGQTAQTSTRLQRILDLWFDEPNLRNTLPGP